MKIKCIVTLICVFMLAVIVTATEQTVPVGEQFRDTSGNLLHAHGGGICVYNGYYYWFGENRSGDILISCYRSTDMKNWEFRNHVLRHSSHSELEDANIERPKVIYNPSTGQFVMWAHKELSSDYSQARAAIAVCNTIDGNYTWQRSFRPLNHMSRDCTLYVDDDGSAYFISSADNNYDLHIYRLTNDFLDVQSLVYVFDGDHREAPAIFKHKGVYFLITSGATGWDPNQAKYSTATSLSGSWSEWQNIGNGTTYNSQSTYVQHIQGSQMTSYLYIGDRWAGAWDGPVNDSRYVWIPINIDSATSISLSYSSNITIDTDTGLVMNGAEVSENGRDVIYLNDITSGKGRNQFEYVGSWSYGSEAGAYKGDNHWNSDTGEYYQVRFYGIQIEVYGARAPNHGIAAMSIDGGSETNLDFYADSRSDQALVYTSQVLSEDNHTLRVRVTGNQNSSASGAAIPADMVKVIVSDGSTPSPTPVDTATPTHTPTPTPIPTSGPFDCSNVPEWDAGAVYENAGMRLVYNGYLYENSWYSSGQNPEENSGANEVWTLLGPCDSDITPSPTPATNLGDVNSDGSITIVDALLTAQFYVGLDPANFDRSNADTNCDETVSIVDALLIAQYYVDLITVFCE